MTDTFSKFTLAVIMPTQEVKTVSKTLVDKWYYTYGIPARIHSDQSKGFNNKIVGQLCKLCGTEQSTTTPYNHCRNSPCEGFNNKLQSLLRILPKDLKPKLSDHLGALVFTDNVTPHATTQYQPSQLMFGCKAQTPCDNCLELSQYDCIESISKSSWIQGQYELVQTEKKWALKSIWQSTQCSAQRKQGKALEIPNGNLVMLHDHPERHDKILNNLRIRSLLL